MTPSLVGFQQTSPGASLLFHLTDNHGSCKGHIRNRLHTTPVIRCTGWYLLHKTVIFGSSMTPCTHRQTCISQSNPSSPPLPSLPSANMHNASLVVQLKVYCIPNTMICILPTGIAPEYPEFFSRASHAFFRRTDRIQTALAERLLLVCVCSCLCVCVFLGKEHGVYVCVAGRLVLI